MMKWEMNKMRKEMIMMGEELRIERSGVKSSGKGRLRCKRRVLREKWSPLQRRGG